MHVAVLYAWLPASVNSDQLGLTPNLFLVIEKPASRTIEHPAVAELLRAEPTRDPRRPQPRAVPVFDPDSVADLAEQAPPVTAAADGALATAATADQSAALADERETEPEALQVLSTSGAAEDSYASEAVAIRTRERRMLAKRVDRLANQLLDAEQSSRRVSWRYRKRQYSAVITREPAADEMDFETVSVEIETTDNGQALTSRVQLRRLAFSHFTQLVDQWDPMVQLHDDEITGRFHSNSELVLGWSSEVAPRFSGLVTTSHPGYSIVSSTSARSHSDIFRGGIETGARRISLPQSVLTAAASPGARNIQVRSFERDTRIEFHGDGTMTWRAADGNGPAQHEALPTTPLHLSAGPGTMLYVQGVVRGVVLVYSPKRIVITGSLRYARDPRRTGDAEDFLGLVSGGNIVVGGTDEVPPGDLVIEAAIYARNRFLVSDASARQRAKLTIYGSLSAGSISETEPRYATQIKFDQRFERVRPPGFPLTNRYEVTAWDEQWRPID